VVVERGRWGNSSAARSENGRGYRLD